MVGDLDRGDLGDLDLDDDLDEAIDEFFDVITASPPAGAVFLGLATDFFRGGIFCTLYVEGKALGLANCLALVSLIASSFSFLTSSEEKPSFVIPFSQGGVGGLRVSGGG